jgi:hypothetical protein
LGCGVKTRVKTSRLGQKLRCRNCQTIMHLGEDGVWRLGLPPEKAEDDSMWFRAPQGAYWHMRDLTRSVPLLRHRVVLVALAAALIFAIGVAVATWPDRVTSPSTLMGRAIFLCDALLAENAAAFQACVDSTPDADGLQLYDKVRTRLARTFAAAKPEVRLRILYENADQGTGCVIADFCSVPDERSAEQRKVSIALFCTKTGDGTWLLDAKRTAADL